MTPAQWAQQRNRDRAGRYSAKQHGEAAVDLGAIRRRERIRMAQEWEQALDDDNVDRLLVESLQDTVLRDVVMATASSDTKGLYERAFSGGAASGLIPREYAAEVGREPTTADREWVAGIYVGEGVEPGERMRRLDAATAQRDELDASAASAAASVHGWPRWQLGDQSGARATLAAEVDENPDNQLADLLLQVMDARLRREGY